MDRRIRYEVLQNEEESGAAEPVVTSPSAPLPPAPPAEVTMETETASGLAEPELVPSPATNGQDKMPEPPPYSIATDLPTYEEAERTKQTDEEFQQRQEAEQQQPQLTGAGLAKTGDIYLGTDGIFVCSFLIAFLFNWLGLISIMCMSQTIAARFGGVAGFGLSIVKWVAIMKYQHWTEWNDGFSWLWWFLIFLGLLMFFRGCMQYIRIKNQWAQLSQQMRGRIYLYF